MAHVNVHIDAPADVRLIIERDTTPKIDLLLYEDRNRTIPIDVSEFAFEAYFKRAIDTDNADAALSFGDGDIVKQADGTENKIRIPITQDQSNDPDQLLSRGVWILYWTDSDGHRTRLLKGEFEARS